MDEYKTIGLNAEISVSVVPTLWDIHWTPVGRQHCEKQFFKIIDTLRYNQTSFLTSGHPYRLDQSKQNNKILVLQQW